MTEYDRPEVPATVEEAVELFRFFVDEYIPAGPIDETNFAIRLIEVEHLFFNVKLAFDAYRQRIACRGSPVMYQQVRKPSPQPIDLEELGL